MPESKSPLVLFALSAAVTAAIVFARTEGPVAPEPRQPDFRIEEFEGWAPTLERGGTVELVRRLCDRQKAEHLSRHGTPAPDRVAADRIETFGPLPDARAQQLARQLDEVARATLARAESMPADDLEGARAQMAEMMHGLKARSTAQCLREGRYWTVAENEHPVLPEPFSYWHIRAEHRLADGRFADVFVPLDLREPELAATYEALMSLEAEQRRGFSEEFNRIDLAERRAICEAAWAQVEGGAVERRIPDWFWKLRIDPQTWRASPLPTPNAAQ
jgi:hypothetical protein